MKRQHTAGRPQAPGTEKGTSGQGRDKGDRKDLGEVIGKLSPLEENILGELINRQRGTQLHAIMTRGRGQFSARKQACGLVLTGLGV